MKRAMAAVAIALVLAGCGGGDDGGGEFETAADVAKAVGCTGYEGGETQMYTQESGSCTIGDQTIYIATFADEKSRDNWLKVAKEMGASGSFALGEKWALQGDDRATVQKAAEAAGGELQ